MKLKIKVLPSSSKNSIAGWLDNRLKVKVKAPPEKGKANKAAIEVLEKILELPKGSIRITSGATSSRNVIEIESGNTAMINKKLETIHNKQL